MSIPDLEWSSRWCCIAPDLPSDPLFCRKKHASDQPVSTVALRIFNPPASGLGIEPALERHFPTDDQQKKEIRDLLLTLKKSHDNRFTSEKISVSRELLDFLKIK